MIKRSLLLIIPIFTFVWYLSKASDSNHRPLNTPITINKEFIMKKTDAITLSASALASTKSTFQTKKTSNLNNKMLEAFNDENEEEIINTLENGADPDLIINKRQYTFLMDQSYNCNPKVIIALLKAGADINRQDTHGNTALHYSAKNGNIECIKILSEQSANKMILNKDHKKAIDIARENDYQNILKYL